MKEDEGKIIASVDLKTLRHGESKAFGFLSMGKRLFGLLVFCELLLAAGHIWAVWFPGPMHHRDLVLFFHMDHEGNLPTWFSSAQFMLLAYMFFALYCLELYRHTGRLWLICAIGAVFLSMDEGAGLHELLGTCLGLWFAKAPEGTWFYNMQHFPSYYWVLVYLPVALIVCIIILRILSKELQGVFRYFFAGVIVYGMGAVVLDFLEGRYGTSNHEGIYIKNEGGITWLDVALVEEMMEMVGVSLVILALSIHYAKLQAVSNSSS